MGYVREPTVYSLTFADGELAGLKVRIKALSVGETIALNKMGEEEAARLFADKLIAWNLEEPHPEMEGCPILAVPATYEAVLAQEDDFIAKILTAWLERAAGVDIPLGKRLNGGETSLVASLPMEPLSQNQAS